MLFRPVDLQNKRVPVGEFPTPLMDQLTFREHTISRFNFVLCLFPLHRYTGLKSDLFASEYTECLKQVEKGELLYGTANKKVRWRARGTWEPDFICRDGAAFAEIREKSRSTGPKSGQLARGGGQLAETAPTARDQLAEWVCVPRVNWLCSGQLVGWWDGDVILPVPENHGRGGSTGPYPPFLVGQLAPSVLSRLIMTRSASPPTLRRTGQLAGILSPLPSLPRSTGPTRVPRRVNWLASLEGQLADSPGEGQLVPASPSRLGQLVHFLYGDSGQLASTDRPVNWPTLITRSTGPEPVTAGPTGPHKYSQVNWPLCSLPSHTEVNWPHRHSAGQLVQLARFL